MEEKIVVGIDFGNTYIGISYYQSGVIHSNSQNQNLRKSPAFISFTDNEGILYGEQAMRRKETNPINTIYNIKKMIGKSYSELCPNVKNTCNFKFQNNSDKLRIEITSNRETRFYSITELASMLLHHEKEVLEAHLGVKVKEAVIAVPSYFNDDQRQATKEAGNEAGFSIIRLVNEPSTIAMGYVLAPTMEIYVLVFDMGASTLDVTLLKLDDYIYEVIASSSDQKFGGNNFTDVLAGYLIEQCQEKTGIDLGRVHNRLQLAAERMKRTLSTDVSTTIQLNNLVEDIDFELTVSRARFEQLNNDLFGTAIIHIHKVLNEAKIKKNQVDEVILAGGSSLIPRIQTLISDFFDGKILKKSIHPEDAIAYGATLKCHEILKPVDQFPILLG